jgi:deoxyadenosine/deoxycytidine kinase
MNWFDLFYRNQERWSCTFQFKVMQTQFEMLSKLKEEHLAAKSGKPLVIITERSPLDGLEIFSDTLKADGAMTEAEYQLVKWYSSQFLWLPN